MINSPQKNFKPFIPHDVALMIDRENVPLLRAWRIRLGMDIDQIAAASGLHPELVSKLDQQENKLSPAMVKIARAMNLEVDQLVDIPA